MKKISSMLMLVGVVTFSLSSCGKEETQAIEQTLKVELAQNETYTFTLPENLRKDAYEFTTQASHYSVSTLGKNSSGDQVYQYTPALDYVGTDQVVVTNDHENNASSSQGCNQHGNPGLGQCTGGGGTGSEDHYVVTIDFTVGSNDAAASR